MQQRDSFFGRQPAPAPTPSNQNKAAVTTNPAAAPAPARTAPQAETPPLRTPAPAPVVAPAPAPEPQGSQLIVGPNIKLKGVEITDCDTLVVEGHVEATMDSRAIQISQQGTFSGIAGIDIAEIRGGFSGEITVRKLLTVYSTGKVSGKIRYGKLVIEEGGELSGDVKRLSEDEKSVRIQVAAKA